MFVANLKEGQLEELLHIPEPWYIERVDFSLEAKQVDMYVKFHRICNATVLQAMRKSVCSSASTALTEAGTGGFVGSKTWVGFGIWVHNLRKAAQMAK